jgi:hypothetical protein
VLERGPLRGRLRQARHQPARAGGEATQDGVREGNRALAPGRAHQLDRLVDRRVHRDALHVDELVGARAQRRPHGRVELAHRAAADRLDGVVERAHPLHGAVGDPHRERPLARVQCLRRRAEGAVGVRALLEDAPHDLVRHRARRHRRPRTNSA